MLKPKTEKKKQNRYSRLGKSDLVVSKACLGTMTWGEQNSDEEAFEQCNMAFHEFGVNFIVRVVSLLSASLSRVRCYWW